MADVAKIKPGSQVQVNSSEVLARVVRSRVQINDVARKAKENRANQVVKNPGAPSRNRDANRQDLRRPLKATFVPR